MSESAGVVEQVAVVSPGEGSEAPASATPTQVQQETPQPVRNKDGYEMRAMERARVAAEQIKASRAQAAAERSGPPRDASGKFVAQDATKTETPAAATTPQPETGAAPEAAPTQDPATSATPELPKTRRIELPPDHPLRDMGADAITASSDQDERAIRALVNGTYTRVKENEQLQARLRDAETKHNELVDRLVRVDAEAAAEVKFKQTPEYGQAVAEYREMVQLEQAGQLPQGRSQKYWEATVGQLFNQFRQQEVGARMETLSQERGEQAGQAWVGDAVSRIGVRYPEEVRAINGFDGLVQRTLTQFNSALETGTLEDREGNPVIVPQGDPEALHKAYENFFQQRLEMNAGFQGLVRNWHAAQTQAERSKQTEAQRLQAEQQRKAAEQAAIDKFKQDAATRRTATPPNPMAGIQHGARAPVPSNADSQPVAARNQFEWQRGHNDRAAQRAAAYNKPRNTP